MDRGLLRFASVESFSRLRASSHAPTDSASSMKERPVLAIDMPEDPDIPGVRLGRLAVDRQYQGKGQGELLLIDALTRARRIDAEAGGIGLFVDALDESASGCYRRLGFEVALDNRLLLFLSAKAAK